jgi:hypothetical protein
VRIFATSLLLGSALLLAAPAPASAQGRFGAGLSFLHDGDAENTATGVTLDFFQGLDDRENVTLGWVGDLGWHPDDDQHLFSLMAGARVLGETNPNFDWFGQFLLGFMRSSAAGDAGDLCDALDVDCDETGFSFGPGFGVDIPINERVNLRGQVDFLWFTRGDETSAAQRFWVGVSLPVGGAQP